MSKGKEEAEKTAAIQGAKTLRVAVKTKLHSSTKFISAELFNEVNAMIMDLEQKIDNKTSKSTA